MLQYWPQVFTSDRQRVEFLFALYESITATLLWAEKTMGWRWGRKKVHAGAQKQLHQEVALLLRMSDH